MRDFGLRRGGMRTEAIREGGDGIYVHLDVHPGARKTRLGGRTAAARGAIRIDVAAKPERGAANRAICSFLEGLLGPGVRVLVVRGLSSHRKVVYVAGTSLNRVTEALARGPP